MARGVGNLPWYHGGRNLAEPDLTYAWDIDEISGADVST